MTTTTQAPTTQRPAYVLIEGPYADPVRHDGEYEDPVWYVGIYSTGQELMRSYTCHGYPNAVTLASRISHDRDIAYYNDARPA